MQTRHFATVAGVTIGAGLLAGCGAVSGASTAEPRASSASPQQFTSSTVESGCAPAATPLVEQVLSAQAQGAGLQPASGATWRSTGSAQRWLVAVRFTTDGVAGEQIGVWATDNLDPGIGAVTAVDNYAKSFTVWPAARGLPPGHRSVDAARACLEK